MAHENKLFSLTLKHAQWRMHETLNLIPSENITSPQVRELLASDLGHRYTLMVNSTIHGVYINNAYGGTKFTDQIETESEEIAKHVFGARFCTLKPLSGHIAGMIMLFSLCARNDLIMAISADLGGYDGYMAGYMPDKLGLHVDCLPFVERDWNVDFEIAPKLIRKNKPRLVILGASFILFPYDIKPIREACDDVNAFLGYDASHVLGLIAGGEFQKPLKDGVDLVVGSTHKTLFGPQGGLMITNREDVFDEVSNRLAWHTLDNPHQNRIAALGQALLEAKEFGSEYARQIIKNSKRLANALNDLGIPVLYAHKDFTQSHQVLLDLNRIRSEFGLNSTELMNLLESENMIIDAVGRLGTNEMTRRGCKEDDMERIAEFFTRIVKGKEKKIKNEIIEFLKDCKLTYCFDDKK